MHTYRALPRKITVLLTLIVCVFFFASAFAAATHDHPVKSHCCELCHCGPVLTVISPRAVIRPPQAAEWRSITEETSKSASAPARIAGTRAPPTASF